MKKSGIVIFLIAACLSAVASPVFANAKWEGRIGGFFEELDRKQKEAERQEAERMEQARRDDEERYRREFGGTDYEIYSVDKTVVKPGLNGENATYSSLSNFKSISEEPELAGSAELRDGYENTYDKAYIKKSYHCRLEYNVNGKYKAFVGTLYVPEGTTSSSSDYFVIKADGKEIFKSVEITRRTKPIRIYADISNADTVEIDLPWSGIPCCLADAGFSVSPMKSISFGGRAGTPVFLESLKSIGEPLCQTNITRDNYGNVFPKAFGNFSYHTRLEYLLNEKYSTFSAVLFIPEGTETGSTDSFSLVADGKEIYKLPNINRGMKTVYLEVSVSGCNSFRINLPWSGIPCYMTGACFR
ncbi:MAG: NPCBM/NEW2 domain-containing protein [Abditibacteriota bacterium]|nr:NPCBM/NEW2 domain-containing protein [Abditibacteriota bacterium]